MTDSRGSSTSTFPTDAVASAKTESVAVGVEAAAPYSEAGKDGCSDSLGLEGATAVPGSFSLLYESRDRQACLFEDAAGHLTMVPTSRLA